MTVEFKGRQLLEYNLRVNLLRGPFGAKILAEYSAVAERDYGNNEELRVLTQKGRGIVTGSSPLSLVALNDKVLKPRGLRTATQRDLELILRHKSDLDLEGTYEDTGLVLRSEADPKSYLARDLARQLRERNPDLQYPVVVHLSDLKLRVDSDSSYGLAFDLTEGATPLYAPVLNSPNNSRFNSSDIDESTGLPKQVGKVGERYLWTGNSGLSRLFLDEDFGLSLDDGDLAGSGSDGRVVVVKVA